MTKSKINSPQQKTRAGDTWLPVGVTIGKYRYEIIFQPTVYFEKKSVRGLIDVIEKKIWIATKGLPPETQQSTLLHEIMHGIYFEYSFERKKLDEEEKLVSALETPLFATMNNSQNRFVFSWIGLKSK